MGLISSNKKKNLTKKPISLKVWFELYATYVFFRMISSISFKRTYYSFWKFDSTSESYMVKKYSFFFPSALKLIYLHEFSIFSESFFFFLKAEYLFFLLQKTDKKKIENSWWYFIFRDWSPFLDQPYFNRQSVLFSLTYIHGRSVLRAVSERNGVFCNFWGSFGLFQSRLGDAFLKPHYKLIF